MSQQAPQPAGAPVQPDAPPQAAASPQKPPLQRVGNVIFGRFGRNDGTPKAIRRTAEERAFLPAALELVETPPSPTLRLTSLAICTLIAVAILWASLSHIDTVAVAPGKVVPLGQVKVVQPLETAAIRAIHVDDGDHVSAGQPLVDLDPTEVKADLAALLYDHGQAELDAEVARVLATRDPATEFHAPEGVAAALAEASHAQALSEIGKHLAQIAGITADIAQRRAMLEANAVQIARARDTLPLLAEKLETARTLYGKGFGPRPAMLEAQQQRIEKQAELDAALAATRQIEAEMRSLESRREENLSGFLADATDRRTKALQKIATLDQQIRKARQRESYRRLVAPVDGTVQAVKVHTPGAVVTTADVLMTIVPDDAGIEIDAQVENKDIGFVREGQEVEIKVDAFPFTRYGLMKGRVRRLGRDAATAAPSPVQLSTGAVAREQADAARDQALSYPAKISLERDWMEIDGKHKPIRPGMRVSAEIRTGERRVIEYLLSPVMQTLQEAGHER